LLQGLFAFLPVTWIGDWVIPRADQDSVSLFLLSVILSLLSSFFVCVHLIVYSAGVKGVCLKIDMVRVCNEKLLMLIGWPLDDSFHQMQFLYGKTWDSLSQILYRSGLLFGRYSVQILFANRQS
jgi:hypothetical protein